VQEPERCAGLAITAMEPVPAMLAKLRSKREFQGVVTVEGFCDNIGDRHHFNAAQFDALVSRPLVKGLFDPLTAFRNWLYWLSPDGAVVVFGFADLCRNPVPYRLRYTGP
jgi:hypothetical protein